MVDFDDVIDRYVAKELKPKIIGRYYPSEVGQCMRKSWYSYKSPKAADASMLKIFEAGNRVHEFVVDVLKSEKTPEVELLESELPVTVEVGDVLISGRIDNLIKLTVENKVVLVEVKSTGWLSTIAEPKDAHVMQLQIYLHALDISEGMLLYVEKNTFKTKMFSLNYDKEMMDRIVQRFKKLHSHLVNNKLPDPEARLVADMKWMCKSCPYNQECYETTPKGIIP
jgi:CRISPR/Cas system-associated exonuclease Cas4 (RecB family)